MNRWSLSLLVLAAIVIAIAACMRSSNPPPASSDTGSTATATPAPGEPRQIEWSGVDTKYKGKTTLDSSGRVENHPAN